MKLGLSLFIAYLTKGNKIKWWAVGLFLLSYPLEFIFWKFDTTYWNQYDWDWFVFLDVKMKPAWVIKFCLDEVSEVVRAYAIYVFLSSSKTASIYILTALENLAWRGMDLIFWFLWFKKKDMYYVHWIMFIIIPIIYYFYFKGKNKKREINLTKK